MTMSLTNEQNGTADSTGEREPKRRRSAPPPLDLTSPVEMKPEKIVDVIENGDVLLVVRNLNGEDKK